MKTSSIVKFTACILATVATFQVISNVFQTDSVSVLNYPSVQSKGRQNDYAHNSAMVQPSWMSETANNADAAGETEIILDKPEPLFVDFRNDRENKNFDLDVEANKNMIYNVKVEDAPSRQAIKTILNKHRKRPQDGTDKLTSGEKRREIKSLSRNFFSSGFGLRPMENEAGDRIWMENGVIYQPIKKDFTKHEKYPAPRLVDYEPFIPFNETMFFTRKQRQEKMTKKKKIITWYTPARYATPADKPEPLRFCPQFPCLLTTNKKYYKDSSLVVFNGQRVGTKPPVRSSPDQIFMFHNQEPPLQMFFKDAHFHEPDWRGAFNWTMSYRSDSTIPSYYGIIRKHPNPPRKDYGRILSQKNGTVAWMVSHCGSPSRRDKYVNELKKYVDVDIYGRCGNFKCPRSDDEKCNSDIAKRYKFYLGFENGICPDYVSEKFFRFMSLDIVTVSRAMKDGLHPHAAPGTYIDTNNFATPKRLGSYLTYLAHNDAAYTEILREKDKYIYLFEEYAIRAEDRSVKYIHYHYEAVPFCQACQKLWNLKENAQDRIEDIQEWFDKKLCVEPGDLEF